MTGPGRIPSMVTFRRWAGALALTAAAIGLTAATAAPSAAASACPAAPSDAYAQAVLSDGPNAYYRLSDGAGGVLCDASGQHRDGTYSRTGIRFGQPGVLGQGLDTAITADGRVDPAVGGGPSGIGPGMSFTLEGWFRATVKQSEMVVSVGTAGNQDEAGVGPWIGSSGGKPATYMAVDTFDGAYSAPTAPTGINPYDGGWHEAAAVYSAPAHTFTLYLDGRRVGGTATLVDHPVNAPVRIGWWSDTYINQPFAGSLGEIAVYPRALTLAQLLAHFTIAQSTHAGSARVSTIASSLQSPWQAFRSLGLVAASGAIAAGGALFLTFPSNLFNLTFQENYAEIRSWWRRWVGRAARLAPAAARRRRGHGVEAPATGPKEGVVGWPVFLLVIVTGAVFGCLLDPGFGFTLSSLATFLATALAIMLGVAVSAAVAAGYHRTRHGSVPMALQALPGGLLVAALCVAVSRLSGFEPGYLYGVVAGVTVARALPRHEQGHMVALSTLARILVSVAAWFLWVPVNSLAAAPGASFWAVLLDDFVGAIFVSGLVGSVISLLPLQFLPGATLKRWRGDAWWAVFGLSLFLLVDALLQPHGSHASTTPLVTTIVLFVLFGGSSVALREVFASRRRRARAEPTPALRERVRQMLAPAGESSAPAAAHPPEEEVTELVGQRSREAESTAPG